jgi:epoxide hydrolase-like predicted phosphatase
MTPQKPDLIIFDLGRVLVDFNFRLVIQKLARYTRKSEKEIRHFFVTTPLWDTFERGGIEPGPFFNALKKELRLEGLTFQSFLPIWNEIFTEKHDTVAIARKLKGRYRLAILSNVNILHWEHVLDRHAFIKWFDHPIASYAVGYRKPEIDIYRLTLHRAGVSPERAVFIDDVESHIRAAKSLGIRAHQFISAPQLLADLDGILE